MRYLKMTNWSEEHTLKLIELWTACSEPSEVAIRTYIVGVKDIALSGLEPIDPRGALIKIH